MTAPRLVTLALLALLLMAQAGLWLGDAGLPRVAVLRAQLWARRRKSAMTSPSIMVSPWGAPAGTRASAIRRWAMVWW